MATGLIVRRGGGSRKVIEGLVAAIGVQYPVGWTCTCTKDGTTLTAKNTSGLVVFSLPAAGTWTVTATTGSGNSAQSKNAEVTIAENEVKRINLRSLEVLTPANGKDEEYNISGNAGMSGNAIEENSNGGFYLSKKVDLTSYEKLKVVGTLIYMASTVTTSAFGVRSSASASSSPGDLAAYGEWTLTDNNSEKTVEINVSALSGEYYLCSARTGNRMRYTSIILE